MKKQFTIIILLLQVLFSVNAEGIYSLQRCLETGLEQNYEIKIVRNAQQISDNNVTLENAGYLPSVNVNTGYSGTLNDVTQYSSAGNAESNNGIHNNALTASVNLN